MASKVSDWPSLLTVPLTGRNSTPPGSAPRSAWNATWPRQPFSSPGTERLGRIAPRRADRQRKGRREIERVESHFALDVSFAVKRHRQMPAQPRARDRAVEIVEGQPVAGQRQARGKADVLRQRVARLEIEQRREADAANVQADARLGVLRPGIGGALRLGIEPGSRDPCLQPQRRVPHARHRSLELRRAVAGRDRAVEPEQRQQRAALIRRQFRFDAEFAAPERIEIDAAQRRDLGRCRDRG